MKRVGLVSVLLVALVACVPPEPVSTHVSLVEASIPDLQALMEGGELTSRELVSAYLVRIALYEERLNAAVAINENALAEADELRRALLSAVSHDLRTPLAAVKAASSSLRSTDVEFSAEDTAELLATIDESADQLTALVGNLLDSSRLQAGVVRPTLTPIYVEDAVQRALSSSSTQTSSSVAQVSVDVGDVQVLADFGLLERVLANLVDNSVRHGLGSDIRIGALSRGDRASITVADRGPGVDRDAEQSMFDAFQRLGDRNATVGVGLGLSVVRGFVEAMGGSVDASETPGGGLTVTIDLAAPREQSAGPVAES